MNIIELAREAHGAMLSSGKGMHVWHGDAYVGDVQEFCERFAHLVRAAALEEAAKVCEEYDGSWYVHRKGAAECASAIRFRALKSGSKNV